MEAPSRRALTGVIIPQFLLINVRKSDGEEETRFCVVWGPEHAYSAKTFHGLFDQDQARKLPRWAREQIMNLPAYTIVADYRNRQVRHGGHLSSLGVPTATIEPRKPEHEEEDEDGVAQW